jgi:hypothetical protein
MKDGTLAMTGMLAALLALAGCEGAGEERRAARLQPLDGGYPLQASRGAEADRAMAEDPCRRRERGGWHSSIGHCEEMLPVQPIAGVLVVGFEEASFFPGAATIPDPDDPRRYRFSLEADFEQVRRLAGARDLPSYQAYRIGFVGRRTRYPVVIDCEGGRSYVFVANRVDEARYLGEMPAPDLDLPRPPPDTPFARSGEGGRMQQLEDQALANCFRKDAEGPG